MGCPIRFSLAIPLAKLLHHRVDVLIENSCCLCLAQCAYQLIVNALFSPSWPALWPDWWRAWLWLNHLASRYQMVLDQHLRLSHPVVQVHWAQMPEFASFRMTRWPAAVAHYGMVSNATTVITAAAIKAALNSSHIDPTSFQTNCSTSGPSNPLCTGFQMPSFPCMDFGLRIK